MYIQEYFSKIEIVMKNQSITDKFLDVVENESKKYELKGSRLNQILSKFSDIGIETKLLHKL